MRWGSGFGSLVCCLLAVLAGGCSDSTEGGAQVFTETSQAECQDGVDNDGDGYTDCGDQDCWQHAVCASGGDVSQGDGESTQDAPAADDPGIGGDNGPQPDSGGGNHDGGGSGWLDGLPTQPGTCEPCGYGELKGKVCAPNEQIFVNDALVTIEVTDCDGTPLVLETKSDAQGVYHFPQVPCGKHTVEVTKGSFHVEYAVYIQTGKLSDITGAAYKLCFQASSTQIAVLQGNWDSMETLLDGLGLEYDYYWVNDVGPDGTILELLSNPLKLEQYQIIFANCGGWHGWVPQDHPEVLQNVKDWILAGGSLYMSDYAWVYGEWSFPDAIEYYQSDDVNDMYTDQSPQLIETGQQTNGQILDGALSAYLGKTSMPIEFDQGPQIAPQSVGPASFAHVHGKMNQWHTSPPITDTIPLVISYKPDATSGRVIYTNFHNDAQVTEDMKKVLYYLVFTL